MNKGQQLKLKYLIWILLAVIFLLYTEHCSGQTNKGTNDNIEMITGFNPDGPSVGDYRTYTRPEDDYAANDPWLKKQEKKRKRKEYFRRVGNTSLGIAGSIGLIILGDMVLD